MQDARALPEAIKTTEAPPSIEVWPFGDLEPGRYALALVDPPWTFKTYSAKGKGKSAEQHYSCMSFEDIEALPVGDLMAQDSACVLWTTNAMLRFGLRLLDVWGFEYKTGGALFKTTSGGKIAFGTGYRLRNACEPFLLGIRGNPKNSRSHRNIILGPEPEELDVALYGAVRQHSRKPDSVYEWCETYVEGPKCELFSRTSRPGWASWGNETGKFCQTDEMSFDHGKTL